MRILIIDDDRELNELLGRFLPRYGYEVLTATDPTQGLAALRKHDPQLVVLDVMLPEKSGFEVCIEIRRFSQVPILMLTARGETNDRILGLELGADDYLPKPYEPRELAARIQSILRRTAGRTAAPAAPETGSPPKARLVVDRLKGAAYLDGRDVGLTTTEFEILALLIQRAGATVTREEIAKEVRGIGWDAIDRSIDVLVSRVRHKLGEDSRQPKFLKTMWGDGYRFIGEFEEIAR
jgi:two-component system phosphate regulon response regulator OmpR